MLLTCPYNGATIDAAEGHAERLIAAGWTPVEKPKAKPRATRRKATKADKAAE